METQTEMGYSEQIDVETVDNIDIPADVLRNALYGKSNPSDNDNSCTFPGKTIEQYLIF